MTGELLCHPPPHALGNCAQHSLSCLCPHTYPHSFTIKEALWLSHLELVHASSDKEAGELLARELARDPYTPMLELRGVKLL